jgi:cell division protein ZapA
MTAEMDEKLNVKDASETIRVNIFDQIYSLRSPKGVEHIRRIASVVDERMRQISAHTTTFELSRIAVLAALNIADELQDLKSRQEEGQASQAVEPPAPSGSQDEASAEPTDSSPTGEEPDRAQTWFEAIFDAEVPVKQRSERLSSQISNKLQTIRQDNSRDAVAAPREEEDS